MRADIRAELRKFRQESARKEHQRLRRIAKEARLLAENGYLQRLTLYAAQPAANDPF
jgi:hypothetical protein